MRARRLSRSLSQLYEDELRSTTDRTIPQFNLLAAVGSSPGVQASALVQPLQMEKSTLSRVLRPLIDEGLIEARPGERRARHLFLTAAGEAELTAAHAAWQRAQDRARSELGPLADALLAHRP